MIDQQSLCLMLSLSTFRGNRKKFLPQIILWDNLSLEELNRKREELGVQAKVLQTILMFGRCHSVSDLTALNYKVRILKFFKNHINVSLHLFMALIMAIIRSITSWKVCKNLRKNNYSFINKNKPTVCLMRNKGD